MIFANGKLLPDTDRAAVIAGLETQINAARAADPLRPDTVIHAVAALGERLKAGEFDQLLMQFLPAGVTLNDLLPLLTREALETKLTAELGPHPFGDKTFPKTTAQIYPLGTLLHITPGNMPGLPVYTALEGLLTGNVNLIKLPHADRGLSLAAFHLLVEQEPQLAPYLYAFDLPSKERETLQALANLSDGIVTWGGDAAIRAARDLAPPGCKLIEWGHRLSFAYISGYQDREQELSTLATHIIETNQRLCSSCQVIYLDTEDQQEAKTFCQDFLPYLEKAATKRPGPSKGAQSTLSAHTALLERIVEGRTEGETLYPGKGCSLLLRLDRDLELSPMEGNVLIKLLPQTDLLPTLRSQKGRLQTAGLICAPEKRQELTALLARAGLTRITRAGGMSLSFPGESHDGEHPLRRYLRTVDIET